MTISRLVLASAMLAATAVDAPACPADLDLGFGESGIATSSLPPAAAVEARDSAVNADGSILVAGTAYGKPTILRFTADGEFDDSFGDGGLAQTEYDGTFTSIALAPDGSIVASEDVHFPQSPVTMGMARFDEDGRFLGMTSLLTGNTISTRQVLVRTDGIIVVVGQELLGSPDSWEAVVYFFSADGGFDPGPVSTSLGAGLYDIATSVVEVEDRAIVIGGTVLAAPVNSRTPDRETFLTKLRADGLPDSTFVSGGERQLLSPGFHEEAWRLGKDAEGRIYVAGNTAPVDAPRRARVFVRRLFPNGTPDLGYGNQGLATIRFRKRLVARGLAVADDGQVTVSAWFTGKQGSLVARLTPDGRRDHSFGDYGVRRLDLGQTTRIHQVALEDDGRVVASGNYGGRPFVLRLEGGTWDGEEACILGCGDGVVAPREQCDDGSVANHDGCSAACLLE